LQRVRIPGPEKDKQLHPLAAPLSSLKRQKHITINGNYYHYVLATVTTQAAMKNSLVL